MNLNLNRKDPLPKKISVIVWNDITSKAEWLGTISEIKDDSSPMLCVSVGWIIHKHKDHITLADSFSKDHTFGTVTCIPTGVIVSIYDLDSESPMKYINKVPKEDS